MSVLLVWQEIPENIRFFVLDGELADKAVRAHNCFVNMVDGDPDGAADELSDALTNLEPLDCESGPIELSGVTKAVTSGFML